jgi:hypothetical protein
MSLVGIPAVRPFIEHTWRVILAGFPGLWSAIGAATILVGGNVLLAFTWGSRHLFVGIAIALAVLVLVVIAGSYRESRRARLASESPHLITLRQLVLEGRAIQARVPERDKRPLTGPPSDIFRDFETWKSKADSALEPWPSCQAQFRGRISSYGIDLFEGTRKFSEIEQRTKVFADITQALIDQPVR